MAAPAAFSLGTYHHVADFSYRRLGWRPTRNLWLLFTPTKLLKRGCDISPFVFREEIGRYSVFSHSLYGYWKKKVWWSRWMKNTVGCGVNVEWNLTGVLCRWSRASIAVVCAVWRCLWVGQQFKSSFCASVCLLFFFYDCVLYQSFMYCLEQNKNMDCCIKF